MVRAIVGANWGDEGKARLRICWQRNPISLSYSRANAAFNISERDRRVECSRRGEVLSYGPLLFLRFGGSYHII